MIGANNDGDRITDIDRLTFLGLGDERGEVVVELIGLKEVRPIGEGLALGRLVSY